VVFLLSVWRKLPGRQTDHSPLTSDEVKNIKKQISVTLVREGTIPTKRPPFVGEVNANISGLEDVEWSEQRIPTVVFMDF
jgi:hypothetical protein